MYTGSNAGDKVFYFLADKSYLTCTVVGECCYKALHNRFKWKSMYPCSTGRRKEYCVDCFMGRL